ncbi:formate dehydrogenase accessory sulfurtransferase FdhD [Pseudorhizobium flavum]|uniref:Sulfur carrier protein FdhD n=1 Tax=Pseudorhizobium flavum TaxID=1335061 RepID=A0A7X0DCX2_9HYPH|nr:formate dehydrogenase accessory sulfurtransferase FdhD [Pseudorhizobium flavum]MBB6180095.1 FdhD protein [Pseudorhizobium flavum]CAD6617334.1 sulfurtransferase FdhD [Pseudorhizobium flavum]CAD6620622.1 sulfurtransferase FdhD [Rhizobium sp. Khangiran2]
MQAYDTKAAVRETIWRNGVRPGVRVVPEEVPIAFSYAGSTHAVMMGTPSDLVDFAIGFSLTEGIIGKADEIEAVEVVVAGKGLDVQISLQGDKEEALRRRRRSMAGPVGCGLCGLESLDQAMRPVPLLSGPGCELDAGDVSAAVAALGEGQPLHAETHAVHGAGFFVPGIGLAMVREDVGRHNALDKLIGAVARQGIKGATGAVVVTSRVSVEMVQKTAILGSPILIAISAPTALAIRTAEEAGMTVVALARGKDFEVFTRSDRIKMGSSAHVA